MNSPPTSDAYAAPVNATRWAKARLRENIIFPAGAKLCLIDRIWPFLGKDGRLLVTMSPAVHNAAAMVNAVWKPKIWAMNPVADAPRIPAPVSNASCLPIAFPVLPPSELRLMYDCAADQ